MTPEENALATLREIVNFIIVKATDDPFLAEAAKYVDSDLVELDERPYQPAVPSEPWWDCYFEEDWDLWQECDCSCPCEENCNLDWAGCRWLDWPKDRHPSFRTWHFKFWGELYRLDTPQMNLYGENSRSVKISMLSAEALLEGINLLIVREITEL
jgi:hypothetical protein